MFDCVVKNIKYSWILIRCHYKYLYILYLSYMTYKYSRASLARTIAHLELLNDHWLKDLYEPLNKRQLELPTVAFYLLIEMVFVFIISFVLDQHA
jgi:hypothetical protein